jgi:hypothetical protein
VNFISTCGENVVKRFLHVNSGGLRAFFLGAALLLLLLGVLAGEHNLIRIESSTL